ncbi:MAG: MFS transporter [Streptosporangiaceae bacterium]
MQQITQARASVAAVFAVHGAVGGAFATRIPWIQEHVHASPGLLGLALLAPAIGSFTMMPIASRLIHRTGGRTSTRLLVTLWSLTLILPALAPTVPVLFAVLLVYGAAGGMCDIAMNAQGVEVEQRMGRSIMSGLHGLWSVGALVGAGLGAVAAHAGIDARVHLTATALVLVALGVLAGLRLPDNAAAADLAAPPRFALPSRAILGIGLVGLCAVFAEGATADWSAVYLRDVAGASEGIAAGSYTAFALMMALSRLVGDFVVGRLGAVRAVRCSGLLAVTGGILVVIARTPAPAIIGFGLIGLGVAVVVPLAFAAAGRRTANPSQGVAGVATLIYSCLLVSPAIVGGLASVTSLSASFAVITAVLVLMTVCAGFLRLADPVKESAAAAR